VTTISGARLSAPGNVTGGNLITAGQVTATGNVTGGNVNTTGQITATGNVIAANLVSLGQITGNVVTSSEFTAIGNVTANTYFGNGAFNSFQYDDISSSTDGTKGTFALRYNQANLSVTDPFALDVAVNGISQPCFIWNTDVIWQTFALGTFKGYTIISSGNITFTTPPLPNSDVVIKTSFGQAVSNTKRYPFLPADIMLGT